MEGAKQEGTGPVKRQKGRVRGMSDFPQLRASARGKEIDALP